MTKKNELYITKINNTDQWLLEKGGHDDSKILLFVHGGPGSTLLPFSDGFDMSLRESFKVFHWDQRFAGKSYVEPKKNEVVSIQTYVDDCKQVIKYIKTKYPKNKLYLVGHSWGSVVGIKCVVQGADVDGYIGVGQLINTIKGREIGFQFLLEETRDTEDFTTVQELSRPPYTGETKVNKLSELLNKYRGVFYCLEMEEISNVAQESIYYDQNDWVKQAKGFALSERLVSKDLESQDLLSSIDSIDVPVLFIHGNRDYATPLSLLSDFYQNLNALKGKKLEVIEDIGHFPFWEKPEMFSKLLEKNL